jgi:Caspase domain
VRINGKGARNVFDERSNARGKILSMTPATLRMRRDQLFDRVENTIEIYGKDSRSRQYYQNWVLRSGSADVNPYFTYVSSMSPADETGVPPDLTIEEPTAPVVFLPNKPSVNVRVKATASADGGIASYTVDGKPGKPAAGSGPVSFEMDVALARGAKALVVEVADRKGNKRTVSAPVVYPGAAPPPKLVNQAWALIIGVSHFTAKAGAPPALPMAAFDAKEMADSLKTGGFKEENIKLLVDDRATVEQVRTALNDFTAKAKPEDLLLVYWSTQGLHDPAAPEKVYLAASDTQLLNLPETAIETSELQLLLERAIRSRHTLLFFDTDHPLGADWGFQGKPIVNTHLLNLFDDQLGRSVIVAGASAGPESGRGAFSNAIIEGLAGKADIDQNHVVTARELCDYVIERVRSGSEGAQAPAALISKREEEAPVLALR